MLVRRLPPRVYTTRSFLTESRSAPPRAEPDRPPRSTHCVSSWPIHFLRMPSTEFRSSLLPHALIAGRGRIVRPRPLASPGNGCFVGSPQGASVRVVGALSQFGSWSHTNTHLRAIRRPHGPLISREVSGSGNLHNTVFTLLVVGCVSRAVGDSSFTSPATRDLELATRTDGSTRRDVACCRSRTLTDHNFSEAHSGRRVARRRIGPGSSITHRSCNCGASWCRLWPASGGTRRPDRCGQVPKGAGGMPRRHQHSGVEGCDMSGGAAQRASIPEYPRNPGN
jgi:hypothetical protein